MRTHARARARAQTSQQLLTATAATRSFFNRRLTPPIGSQFRVLMFASARARAWRVRVRNRPTAIYGKICFAVCSPLPLAAHIRVRNARARLRAVFLESRLVHFALASTGVSAFGRPSPRRRRIAASSHRHRHRRVAGERSRCSARSSCRSAFSSASCCRLQSSYATRLSCGTFKRFGDTAIERPKICRIQKTRMTKLFGHSAGRNSQNKFFSLKKIDSLAVLACSLCL